MEGLIPMVYKAIKRTRTRRQYECISSGASTRYNVAELYVGNDTRPELSFKPAVEKYNNTESKGHRKNLSVPDFSTGFSLSNAEYPTTAASGHRRQLVRFRSQRMLSCLTGA